MRACITLERGRRCAERRAGLCGITLSCALAAFAGGGTPIRAGEEDR